ncbi:hypothetical protein GCM10011386_01500 [Parapedobacter defluvii]|uniref:DUF6259 domain-containing protein n=1 Tax=Parapedobacter defluvii TaxID=2045106 RepID=A0ABQ1L2X8_9SPHI|nr:DUF6259 domain-containing protein [Parapedobacter defluvii]GGC13525.1 hypothetical protein GCM10011386_01500 [Parapedobacter defluvii]
MKVKLLYTKAIMILLFLFAVVNAHAQSVKIENDNFRLKVDTQTGAISSFFVKKNQSELIGENQLEANFRICLPLKDYASNYIDGMEQKPVSVTKDGHQITVVFTGMKSPKGTYPVDLTYWITLHGDYVSFKAKLTNHDSHPISEFWFPRIGGMTGFGNDRDAKLAIPNYSSDSRHTIGLFQNYPGSRGLGAEAAEWSVDYPGMPMPWWDIYDAKNELGLYMGYHDPVCRYSTWHTYLMPDVTGENDPWFTKEQAAGKPVGLVFSHVRYPFIKSGETLESGEFIVRAHEGDWHEGSQFYREWFLSHFPFDKTDSWLRKEKTWFTSIIYQPEDRIVTDFEGYNQWTKEAKEYGINCYELIGWDSGGLERNYPLYVPEEKLGGHAGFKDLLKSIKARGGRSLVFNNYNILDKSTDWYKQELHKYMAQDEFGNQGIWMAWGEGTLLARRSLNARYHVRSSVTSRIEEILEGYFLQLVKDGASGFQIDKLVVGTSLDFNPLNKLKPDVALCEGLVQAIDRLYAKCLEINPDFRMASEFGLDRLLPYFDVGYRNSNRYGVSTLRYVFPEWTSCQHISAPRDFKGVNGAVLTGSVICVEPDSYQGSLKQPIYNDLANYIKEVGRIREILAADIFLSRYHDDQFASVLEYETPDADNQPASAIQRTNPGEMPGTKLVQGSNLKPSSALIYKVHENLKTGRQTLVVANDAADTKQYAWEFTSRKVKQVTLYAPFEEPKTVKNGEILTIKGNGLHILVEE